MNQEKIPKAVVLVFPCGTEIGLEIHRALCQSTHVSLLGGSSLSTNHGAHRFSRYIDAIPFVYDPAFVTAMNAIIEANGVDFIFPAHDDAVTALSRHQSTLKSTVLGSSVETCVLCRSKSATYAKFSDILNVPKVYSRNDKELPFPLFLKPDAGQGSRGARQVNSRKMLEAALDEDPSLIILEYLPGTEYTVDCFTDKHGELRFIGPRERIRTVNGISVNTRTVLLDDDITHFAQTINKTLLLRGAWFFQVKRNARDALTLLEIAPRVSGGMGLYRNLGVNLPLLSIYYRCNMDLEIRPLTYTLEMDRALMSSFRVDLHYTHVYIDLDDTLLQGKGVNVMAIAFLHQCRNEGKKLHLLTRHKEDVNATLANHGLSQLFDYVSVVREEECKAALILQKDAIFIDDSFSERCRVQDATGIPVFAPDALESLLDWRC